MSRATEACATLLQQRFGPTVLCEVVGVDGDPESLWPEEWPAVAHAVETRRREFAAGRACARRLLARLGLPPGPVPAAADRSPLWPAGAIGSIAHSATLCVVAVARPGPLLSLGVDVEPDAPLDEELWATICSPRELDALRRQPASQRGSTARLVFSAKECVYKTLYPVLKRPLEFHEVEFELLGADRFRARLVAGPAAPGLATLEGFVARCAGSLLTGMTLPAAVTRPAATRPAGAGPPA